LRVFTPSGSDHEAAAVIANLLDDVRRALLADEHDEVAITGRQG